MNPLTAADLKTLKDTEHVLLRPELYIGPIGDISSEIVDFRTGNKRVVRYSQLVLKLFDEIFVNALDHYFNCPREGYEISVNAYGNTYSIRNNYNNIIADPITLQKAFATLRTGTNFEDDKGRFTGGMNGLGSKLVAILSDKVQITVVYNKKKLSMFMSDHMNNVSFSKIEDAPNSENYFEYSFVVNGLMPIDVIYNRLMYASYLRLTIKLNASVVNYYIHCWSDFTACFNSNPVFTCDSGYWKIGIGISDSPGFKQISLVNDCVTSKGGIHVDEIVKYLVTSIYDNIKTLAAPRLKQLKIDPKDITFPDKSEFKKRLFIAVSLRVDRPAFSSQAKEKLTRVGGKLPPLPPIFPEVVKAFINDTSIVDQMLKMSSRNYSKPTVQLNKIKKLIEANNVKCEPMKCTLFICEGDSAASMCNLGMEIIGHDYFGMYPLRGKILNVKKASERKTVEDKVLAELKGILGLDSQGLRYGRLVVLKDADDDGTHILTLIMNFFAEKYPRLLEGGYVQEFISPQFIVYLRGQPNYFYNKPQYIEFVEQHKDEKAKVKFIKGLATNGDDNIRFMFNHYNEHLNQIKYDEKKDKRFMIEAFGPIVGPRLRWLYTHDPNKYLVRNPGKPVESSDIINIELPHYAYEATSRAIPSVYDGLKPVQRKIIYTLFNTSGGTKVQKVYAMTGTVMNYAQYHHGDASLSQAIIAMGQDFVGSNNIPLLERHGQFGSRLQLGKDAGAPRYIEARLSPITELIYPKIDANVLERSVVDNETVEPISYAPIIPMVLVNGVNGIGMGMSTTIPSYNPIELIELVTKILNGEQVQFNLDPYYKNYNGSFVKEQNKPYYVNSGILIPCKDKQYTVIVRELPIKMSIYKFIDLLKDLEESSIVLGFRNNCKSDINFEVNFSPNIDPGEYVNILKLKDHVSISNMCLEINGKFKKYNTINEIFLEWFNFRKMIYQKRREYLISKYKDQYEMKHLRLEYFSYYQEHHTIPLDEKYDITTKTSEFRDVVKTISNLNAELAEISKRISTMPTETEMWLKELADLRKAM